MINLNHDVDTEVYESSSLPEHRLWGAVAERFIYDLCIMATEGEWERWRREAARDWVKHRDDIISGVFRAAGFSDGTVRRLVQYCDRAVGVCEIEGEEFVPPSPTGKRGKRKKNARMVMR